MSDRLNEALETWESYLAGIHDCDLEEPEAVAVLHINAAARAYADLVNGERVEPDYAAGVRALIEYETVRTAMDPTRRRSQAVRAIVLAAIGDRLLIDPPKEEE